jgi:hypothetical protein
MASEQDDPCPCGHASATEHNLDALRKNRQLVERMTARIAERDAEIARLREALGAEEGDDAATLIRDTIVERDHYARTTERFARDGDALAAKLAERDAEIARLRAALELLTWVGMDGEPCWCPPEWQWSDHHERCVKTRAALAGGEGNDGE